MISSKQISDLELSPPGKVGPWSFHVQIWLGVSPPCMQHLL